MRLRICFCFIILITTFLSCQKNQIVSADLLSKKERAWLDSLGRDLTFAPDPDFPPIGFSMNMEIIQV